jgi:peptide/nickel transport system substrate-binding protein
LTAEGGIGPDLAKSWDFSNDGTVITFHLQEGVKFHDGTVLDAQAIKWNFDRYLDEAVASPRRAELAPPLERVEVLDSRTLVFHLSAAFRPFLTVITDQAGWMASPTAVKELNSYDDYNGEFGSHPVGTGPFKFEGWLPGRRVRLVSNDNYWEKGKPYLDGIDLPYAEDQQVAFAMARTGNLDVMEYMIAVDVPKAANNQNIDIVSLKAVRTSMMFINITAEPWDNKALRQAFSYAIDREAGVKVLYDGLGNPGYHLPSGAGIWANPEFKMYKYDLQKAKEKLAEAGYANGFTYDQECRASTAELRRCEVLQSMVAKAGITMNIQPHESSTYFWDWYNGHYGTAWMFQSWRVDPHRNMVRQYGCGNFIAKGLHYCNSEVDSLLEEAAKTYDVPKARALYDRAERIIMEAAPVVTFIAEDAYYAINNRVQGLGIPPDQVPRVRNVWLLR